MILGRAGDHPAAPSELIVGVAAGFGPFTVKPAYPPRIGE
jgi:hypothetical protein